MKLITLLEDGNLYSWGFGGKSINPLSNLFNPSKFVYLFYLTMCLGFGALGLGTNAHRDVPTLIEDSSVGSVKSLFSGYNFAGVVNGLHKQISLAEIFFHR